MLLLGRVVIIMIALMIAIMAAGITLALGVTAPDWTGIDSDPVERLGFFMFTFVTTSFVGAYATLPAFLLIILAEATRMRSFLYYGVGGALIGLLAYYNSDILVRLESTTDLAPVSHSLELAAAAGIVAGLVYWALAGCNAGRWRDPPAGR